MRTVLFAIASILTFSACTSLDPYTREEKTSNASKGAAIGAAAGVAVGLITGDDSSERKKRALILGGVGGLTGAAIGNYQDQQELELRKRLEGSGVSVTRQGDDIILNMPGNVTFEVDRSDVNAGFYQVLDSVAVVLNRFDQTMIEVAGHTDSTGAASYNLELSRQRAQSVAWYLGSRGVDQQRVLIAAGGEDYPVASNATPEGRQLNRRVEITIVPLSG